MGTDLEGGHRCHQGAARYVDYLVSPILSCLSFLLDQVGIVHPPLEASFFSPSCPTMHVHERQFEAVDRQHGWPSRLAGASQLSESLRDPLVRAPSLNFLS